MKGSNYGGCRSRRRTQTLKPKEGGLKSLCSYETSAISDELKLGGICAPCGTDPKYCCVQDALACIKGIAICNYFMYQYRPAVHKLFRPHCLVATFISSVDTLQRKNEMYATYVIWQLIIFYHTSICPLMGVVQWCLNIYEPFRMFY